MLAFIEGSLVTVTMGSAIVDVGGLGFRVGIPASTAAKLPERESRVKLYTHLHVKEDGVALYGFATEEEYDLFVLLISVAGIGPKGALSFLSHASASQIYLWLMNEDINQLKKIPGIGNKTAQRLVLELKGKISGLPSIVGGGQPLPVSGVGKDLYSQAVTALCSLGYGSDEASHAVGETVRQAPEAEIEAIIRGALKLLARM